MSALRTFVFLGAFLLFAMEPMVGRLLLPGFGGAFHVWTTSLMFFQGALFFGYLYAHVGAVRLEKRGARRWHLAVLAVPMLLLPPTVRIVGEGGHVASLLATLAVDFGLPFAALATTGVVAQAWLARSSLPGRESPYVLYAVSNAGSLLALVLYALVIEPLVGLRVQRWAWAIGYVAYVVVAFVAYRATRAPATTVPARVPEPETASAVPETAVPEIGSSAAPVIIDDGASRVRPGQIAYWLLLSAFPSIFLMAVTNLIALDAGNVPLVWVIPLALYLGTFILAFSEPSRVPDWVRRLWPHFGAVGLFFFAGGETGGTWAQVVLHLFVLFAICLAAHGELYASRPPPQHLTLYFLVIALGGWIGGAFVALGAPLAFSGLYEYPIAIVGLALTIGVARRADLATWLRGPGRAGVAVTLLLVGAIAWKLSSGGAGRSGDVHMLEVRRSFYGIYYVLARPTERGTERDLVSGTTRHGRQFVAPEHRGEPLSYYHRSGPLGDAMEIVAARGRPRRIGIVGLGVGAAAAYAEPGESIDFFEIDQAVVDLARAHFFYLGDCRGRERTIVGDARLTLSRIASDEPGTRYDLLLVDAFAGDAIPTHLVTREAVELYRSLLAEHGVLLFHVSNRYYDLRPVLTRIASELGVIAGSREQLRAVDPADPSQYFVMLEAGEDFAPFEARGFTRVTTSDAALWTDDHASSIGALLPDWE